MTKLNYIKTKETRKIQNFFNCESVVKLELITGVTFLSEKQEQFFKLELIDIINGSVLKSRLATLWFYLND